MDHTGQIARFHYLKSRRTLFTIIVLCLWLLPLVMRAQTSPLTETFTNLGPYGGYQTETWTGDNGGTWTATDARTDKTINGKAITVQNGKLTSPAVSGGIGSLTVTTQRKYSGGSGNMNLTVNGTTVGFIPYDSTIQTTTISNINLSGTVTIVIDATNSSSDRVAIDDLSWTAFSGAGGITVFWSEPFDDSSQYSVTLGAEGNNGSADYFMLTDGSNINKSYTAALGSFFGGQDIDDSGWSGSANPSQLTWSNIDISGQSNIEFSGLFGEAFDSPGDIDDTDSLLLEYRIDGGNWQDLIAFRNDGSTYNSNFYEDTDFDGIGDGALISNDTLNSFTKPVSGTGMLLDLRFTAAVDAGDEDFAIDEFQLKSTAASGPPSLQASAINFISIASDSIALSWSRGNGDRVLLLVSETTAVDSLPKNGVEYMADSEISLGDTIGTDEFVACKGIDTSATITGLKQGTQYHFRLFEFNNSGTATAYLTFTAPQNPDSVFTKLSDVSNFTIDCISETSVDLSWTVPSGNIDGFIIGMRQSTLSPHSISGKGDTIAADTVFGDGYAFGSTTPQSYVVYNGSGNHVTVTGLSAGQEYSFVARTYQGDSWSDGVTKAAVKAGIPEVSNMAHYGINQKIMLSWSNPSLACVDEIMIVMREANPVTAVPSGNGSAYTASANFGSGTQLVADEFVVYKGTGTNVDVTGLSNGTTYCFKLFVRDGNEWSDGIGGSEVPDDVEMLLPGDLSIVAINTNTGGGDDEISIVALDTIKTNTAIDFTDNGWERSNPDKWGNTEGTIRFTRTGVDILPGEVFTFRGKGHKPGDFTGVGLSDNSWSVSSLNGNYDFNLSTTDQVWVMQYGNWTHGSGTNHDATYSGNILYGWTANGWAGDPGHASAGGTDYSQLYPNTNCYTTNVSQTAFPDKVKYTGPLTSATRRIWLKRINDSNNWTGYSGNGTAAGEYSYSSTPQYASGSYTFPVLPDTLQKGEWLGDVDSNWFNCGNWDDLSVPDKNTNVTIADNALNNAVISHLADFSDEFQDSAFCNNLNLTQDSILLTSGFDVLTIHGDINIQGGVLSNHDGKIRIRGDWLNQSAGGFEAGSGMISFWGDVRQTIENTQAPEIFQRLSVVNQNNVELQSAVETDSLLFVDGRLLLNDYDLNVKDGITGIDTARYVVTKNNSSSAGYLIMEAGSASVLFPVGTMSSYTPATISNSGGTAEFKVRRFDGLLENGYSGGSLSGNIVERSWAIELHNATSADVDILLQWNLSEERGNFGSNRADAVMTYNLGTNTGSGWADWSVLLNSNGTVGGSDPFYIQAFGVNNFGVFSITERCEILKPKTSLIHHY